MFASIERFIHIDRAIGKVGSRLPVRISFNLEAEIPISFAIAF